MGRGSGADGDWPKSSQAAPQVIYQIGIYGWRKRCLYVFILLLMITVIVNIALTVWILKVMDFNIHGMGNLRVENNKIRVRGSAEFLQSLRSCQITTTQQSPLFLESARNITLNSRDSNGRVTNKLTIGDGKIETFAKQFVVKSLDGDTLIAADKNGVELGAQKLTVTGSGGTTFKGSVQTPVLRSGNNMLRVESPTRSIHMSAPENISIRSQSGQIFMKSLNGIRIESLNRAIKLDARTITVHNLPIISANSGGSESHQGYQLCVCKDNGKLFRAVAHGNCRATTDICN